MDFCRFAFNGLLCANAKKGLPVPGIALGLLLFCLPGFAQLNLGSISGAVADQTGGAMFPMAPVNTPRLA